MNTITRLSLFAFLLATVLFTSCKKEYESIESVDDVAIQTYIKANNLGSVMKPDGSGSYYQVIDAGTGDLLANKDSVFFSYQEKSITDGTVYNATTTYGVSGTYYGYMSDTFNGTWGKALNGLKYGAKVRILVPSHLAYGKNGYPALNVPSNAILDTYINTLTYRKQWQLDDYYINTYLTANKLTATKDAATGIYYIVTNPGIVGAPISNQSSLVVNYTGRLLNGTQFDSSTDGTYTTTLNETIKGWGILKQFKPGAKVRLFIPSVLAYGAAGYSSIAPNTVLDFDIEIVSVTN
ncbi:FKBP-type peptidyl-prolyl cis-trans isomerase [Pedobacter mucosus]|uniref:FKBP-type peptidyl-prolyl cis-trans isomerase n=1 Tax=Pedobacter mucosus TaxID=2895286 RepID=UPI001EE3F36E|nr:FKBP-type peptidyl-prolyl cis-trans isomerase [Pedobacter mucosus]UKT63084.1 FKBP-type peptidyl-prolyl cis-trans isomerase [Pedobacter mucosus]